MKRSILLVFCAFVIVCGFVFCNNYISGTYIRAQAPSPTPAPTPCACPTAAPSAAVTPAVAPTVCPTVTPVVAVSPIAAASPTEAVKIPDVVVLGKDAKLGTVTFHHADHFTKNYDLAGTGPITCVQCHHTAQPAADVAKNPLWKTSWPADRTTVLTADLYTKDALAAGAPPCRSCHVKTGEVPKLSPKIPEITLPGSTTPTVVTNMLAFHRRCAGCHTEVVKLRPTVKPPTTMQCTICHKKAA
jgi:hypothetical protein